MMTPKLMNANAVALHLGVSTATLHNWVTSAKLEFPEPDHIVFGPRGRVWARTWFESGFPALRQWVNSYKRFAPERAEQHWAEVDAFIASGEDPSKRKKNAIHPAQLTAFEVAS